MTSWTRQFGTASNDFAKGIAVDSSGNIYGAGTTVDNTGDADCFVVKYAVGGTKLWVQKFGTAYYDIAAGIAVDGSGNFYVTGTTYGGLDGNANAGYADCFVVKYAPDGTKLWTRQFGTASNDFALGIVVDGSGNIYVTGYTRGSFDGCTNVGETDSFVVKYDTNGTKQWIQQFGTTEDDFAAGLAVDNSGYIYVTGYTYGDLAGTGNARYADCFVVKYDTNGKKLWTRQFGTGLYDFAKEITVDSAGNIYVTGETNDELDGNPHAGGYDIFVFKYAPDGTKQWTKQFGTTEDDFAAGIVVDGSGDVYVTGYTSGSFDGCTNAGETDFFAVKYDMNGTKLWSQQFGTILNDAAAGIAVDNSSNVYVTGTTYGSLDGDTNAGGADLFVIKYSADGTKQ